MLLCPSFNLYHFLVHISHKLCAEPPEQSFKNKAPLCRRSSLDHLLLDIMFCNCIYRIFAIGLSDDIDRGSYLSVFVSCISVSNKKYSISSACAVLYNLMTYFQGRTKHLFLLILRLQRVSWRDDCLFQ